MKRLVPLFCLFVTAVFEAGCADSDQGLSILGNYALDTKTCSAPMATMLKMVQPLPRGTYDIGVALGGDLGYVMNMAVINNLPSRVNSSNVELNNLNLVGFEVNLAVDPASPLVPYLPPGQVGLTKRTVSAFGGNLSAGGGVAIAVSEMIGVNVAQALLKVPKLVPAGPQLNYSEILIQIRARGTGSVGNVLSNQIEFPVTICNFCLGKKVGASGVPALDITTGTPFDCPQTILNADVVTSCYSQQDNPSSCCLKDQFLLCGSMIPTTKM